MRIWLINHYAVPTKYYPLARPAHFAHNLQRMGHEVMIIAASTVHNSDMNLISNGEKYREEMEDGIHYVYIRCRHYKGNGLQRMMNICEFALKLPGVCRKFEKPDVIISTSVPPTSCAVGVHLARKYKAKSIAEIADLWPETLIAYGLIGRRNPIAVILRRLEKWIYTKADAVVFTMEGAYDYIKEQGWEKKIPKEKVFYINNGIDLDEFDYNAEHYKIEDEDLMNPDTYKVVYTGSIRRVNNVGVLLDVAKKIKNPKIKFLIWGDGDEFEFLKKRVESEHITNVVFKGRIEKKYVPYIVRNADLNLAHNEASDLFRFGISFNKLFDYMAAGKPILTDIQSNYNPVIMNKCGFEVKNPTPQRIAEEIDRISQKTQKEYEAICKQTRIAAEKYDFKEHTRNLLKIIESIS